MEPLLQVLVRLYLVGGNCATNRRVATLMGAPLVGAPAIALTLLSRTCWGLQQRAGAGQGLDDQAEELEPIREAQPNVALELRIQHGPSPQEIVTEFVKDDDDLAYLPSPAASRTLRKLLCDDSVSKEVHSEAVSIADVRCYFDTPISLWPGLATYLGTHAAIAHNPNFEFGCITVQQGDTAELTRSEKTVLSRFACLPKPTKLGLEEGQDVGSYYNLHARAFDSTDFEQGGALLQSGQGDRGLQRQRLQPATLETILFLRMNDELGDANVVNECCSAD
ncbi:LOW QUALITY PROTEIN: Hypothetical protein PHPALM_19811 [Phytophthora palmivora]|uniref:Uncharacterized protein n=1 Tax=Phytophthora palmivora TaxID=4796 RepID=A0A2P4XGF4_9STRA|nr:LOW QUALITY PROTEIN: Hypothetical protein PHPALM_19811 [Phytophthora palmivora]